ncbi:MAG: pyridoxal phosphate-dependent aminotransferase [Bacteroidia bacterium]|nr:pyridoxal phosphate-dependent aminotransferase [Bacteroidia bacterium]
MSETQLSARINNLEESQTIGMSKLCRELTEKGFDVINLSLGEPDFDTPIHVREAAKKAIDDGYSHYTPISGFADLRKVISEKFKRENALDYSPSQIVVSTGAKQAIANVVLSLVNEGDEVIIPKPYWVSYIEIVKLAEGKPVFIPSSVETNFKITPEQLEKAITPRSKMFIFSSPCNPTGTVYTREELSALAKVFEKHKNVFILSDEIYEHINYIGNHESIAQFPSLCDRMIIVNGVSKSFAMTGWRIGYSASPLWIAQACDKMQGQITSGANSIAQKAAEAALSGGLKSVHTMREAFHRRRDLMIKLFRQIPNVIVNDPDGAFYIFPDVSFYLEKKDGDKKVDNVHDLCMYLLYTAHVSVVPGNAFGDDKCIRLSYSASEDDIEKAVSRIHNALLALK